METKTKKAAHTLSIFHQNILLLCGESPWFPSEAGAVI